MENPMVQENSTRMDLANRLFFRLYQCAKMLHKRGAKAVEEEGLTTQQWAVLGALPRPNAEAGMGVGDLARYLLVSRQNLSGLISRIERDGHIAIAPDGRDRRARLVTMTESGGHVWNVLARPKIRSYYERALSDFSIGDMAHSLHYLLKLLENMKKLDGEEESSSLDNDPAAQRRAISTAAAPANRPPAPGAASPGPNPSHRAKPGCGRWARARATGGAVGTGGAPGGEGPGGGGGGGGGGGSGGPRPVPRGRARCARHRSGWRTTPDAERRAQAFCCAAPGCPRVGRQAF